MNYKHDLITVVNKIKEASGGRVQEQMKFKDSGNEYLISDVTEEMLLDIGFEYKGLTLGTISPYYILDNILAYFDDELLHVVEETYSAI